MTKTFGVRNDEVRKKGDCFYMERLGDEGRGIVFRGQFTSDPYLGEDWAGTSKKRYYVDIDCFDASPADGQPHITVEELKSILPEINWDKGHSGQLLTEGQAQKLDENCGTARWKIEKIMMNYEQIDVSNYIDR